MASSEDPICRSSPGKGRASASRPSWPRRPTTHSCKACAKDWNQSGAAKARNSRILSANVPDVDAILRKPARFFYEAASEDEQDELDRIIVNICRDPRVDEEVKFVFPAPPAVLNIYSDKRVLGRLPSAQQLDDLDPEHRIRARSSDTEPARGSRMSPESRPNSRIATLSCHIGVGVPGVGSGTCRLPRPHHTPRILRGRWTGVSGMRTS